MGKTDIDRRNAAIAEGVRQGRTYQDVGDEHGLSRERVRQIAKRAGVGPDDPVRQLRVAEREERQREAARAARQAELGPLVKELWEQGLTVNQVAERLGISYGAVSRALGGAVPREQRIARAGELSHQRAAPDEEIIESVRNAGEILGHGPSIKEYEELRRGGMGGLSAPLIVYRMGWNNAVRRAGFTPKERTSGVGQPVYTDDQYLAALHRVTVEVGEPPSLDIYDAHRREGEPTGGAFRGRFGGWLKARRRLEEWERALVSAAAPED